jgi:uncharacterized protein (TIGR02594 family)
MKIIVLCCIFCISLTTSYAFNEDFKNYRVSRNYMEHHFDRVVFLGKKFLKNKPNMPTINYCYGMSLYQINKSKLKGNILDQVLKHLKIGIKSIDPKTERLVKSDSTILNEIKKSAMEITLNEFAKSATKTLTRIQTIVAIYGDSVEIYKVFEVQKARIKKNMIQAAVTPSKALNTNTLKDQEYNESPKLVYTVDKCSKNDFLDTIERYCGSFLCDKQKQLLRFAFSFNNIASFSNATNPDVMQFFHQIGFTDIKNDEVNWCAAFVNFCMKKQGYKHPNSLLARSWLKMGQPVKSPQPGDLVIFWRVKQKGWQGHVGFFIKEDKVNNLVYVYGGNQGGTVCLKPFAKDQILGYRRVITN